MGHGKLGRGLMEGFVALTQPLTTAHLCLDLQDTQKSWPGGMGQQI